MSLKIKFTLLLAGLFLGLLLVNISTLSFIVFPAFEDMETREAKKNMGRVIDILESDIKDMDSFVYDWAAWDDTYNYIEDRNQAYVDANYLPEYSATQNHDLYYIWDTKGKPILNKALNEAGTAYVAFDDFPPEGLPETHPFLTMNAVDSKLFGLIQTRRGPMIIATRPIIKSSLQGPIRGILAMGRYLDNVLIKDITQRSRLKLHIWSLTGESSLNIPKEAPRNLKTGDSEIVLAQDEKSIFTFSSFSDIFGNPVILLRVTMPRDIVNQGKSTLSYGVGMAAISGIVIFGILLFILQRSVVSPLSTLARNIVRLGKRENVSQQFPVVRSDELGVVARSVLEADEERNKAEFTINCQNQVLGELIKGDSIKEIFDSLIGLIEEKYPELQCSILILDPIKNILTPTSAPSLPQVFLEYIKEVPVGPGNGSCGTAVSRKETVVVEDIASDPLWVNYKEVALSEGLKACWSMPIFGASNIIIGAFAFYYSEPRPPKQEELDLGNSMVNLAALTIEHKQTQLELDKYQRHLEKMVDQRTAELNLSNHKLIDEIKDRIKTAEELETSLGEKDVLLQEVNHRTKNNMQIITSLIHMQTKKIEDKKYLKLFQESYDRINSMSLLQDKIFISKNLQKIETLGYFKSLADELLIVYSQKTKQNISFKIETNKITLDVDTGINCGLIVNELISNSLKHAFPDVGDGVIMLTLNSTGDGKYELKVTDNGSGIPEEIDLSKPKSTGLKLITQLGKRNLEGDIIWERGQGTCFKLIFKIPKILGVQ